MERTLPVVGVGRGPGSGGRGLTNIQDEEDKKEFFDNEQEFSRKLDKVAQWVRESKYTILFTGAGVSTRYVLCYVINLRDLLILVSRAVTKVQGSHPGKF